MELDKFDLWVARGLLCILIGIAFATCKGHLAHL
jgi:hypothetical protein